MINDTLEKCNRCGEHLCYKQEVTEEIYVHQCIGCGFWTNSLMKEDSLFYKEQCEILPEVYKDFRFTDENNLIWLPVYVKIPEKGSLFLRSGNPFTGLYEWVVIKDRKLEESEKKEYIKKLKTVVGDTIADPNTLKAFSPTEFVEAMEYLGVL